MFVMLIGTVCDIGWLLPSKGKTTVTLTLQSIDGSCPGREIHPIIACVTATGAIKALNVSMSWKEIDAIVDGFSFEESDLRKDEALQWLQKLNPLVGTSSISSWYRSLHSHVHEISYTNDV